MKLFKIACLALIAGTMTVGQTSCSSFTKTGKGALIGGGGGAALGAGLGALIGGGKGAGIGSAIGAAVGAGAGALIGNRMDKQQRELEEELGKQATVEKTTDQNGLQAIKVTFEGGILFPTGKYTLSPQAQSDLARFANSLKNNPDIRANLRLHRQHRLFRREPAPFGRARRRRDELPGQQRGVAHTPLGTGHPYGRLCGLQ